MAKLSKRQKAINERESGRRTRLMPLYSYRRHSCLAEYPSGSVRRVLSDGVP